MYILFAAKISALANHHSEFGVTDALCSTGSCLLSSAYDYDTGAGYINGEITAIFVDLFVVFLH